MRRQKADEINGKVKSKSYQCAEKVGRSAIKSEIGLPKSSALKNDEPA
jgi:hypothetical protein